MTLNVIRLAIHIAFFRKKNRDPILVTVAQKNNQMINLHVIIDIKARTTALTLYNNNSYIGGLVA
jgi:hypothetical protein